MSGSRTAVQEAGGACAANALAALDVQNLTWAVGGAAIVTDVSFTVADGDFVGLIGPNGAGKTSLLNLLSGLVRASAGSILLHGRRIDRDSPQRRAAAGLGRTFQSSTVFPALTVLENVRLAAQARLGGSLRLWRRANRVEAALRAARECLQSVGLAERAALPAGVLSHGDKRKLELALLLAARPSVFLLDEPMAGVSAEDVPQLTGLIGRVCRERRATVIMVEHHMNVVLALADRLAVMHHGRLLAYAAPADVMADDTVQAAYIGEAL
ncbi:MAG: ABC transporter ATP-binding protein [Rhodanobacteraceae bacterium]